MQFLLCLIWVSEIINPTKTYVDFGIVTDIFLRIRSGLVRFKYFYHCTVARNELQKFSQESMTFH